jgi:hypothetical protein
MAECVYVAPWPCRYPRETYKMMVSPRFNFIGCWSMGFGVCAMGFSDLGHLIMPADVAYEIAYWMYNINLVFSVLCALVPVLYISVRSDTTYARLLRVRGVYRYSRAVVCAG